MASAKYIRQARLTDINAIYDIIREHPKEVLPRSFHDISAHFDRFYVYDDGEVRGVISWQVLPSIEPEHREFGVEIISFSVHHQDQGTGVGGLLLKHTLDVLKKYGPDRIIVLTFYPKFFARYGFRETSKETLYQKIYQGCIHCTKYKSPLLCPEVAMEYVLNKNQRQMNLFKKPARRQSVKSSKSRR
jgi:N-acetylglutamate synthase-like GNAT family acetyltransferase